MKKTLNRIYSSSLFNHFFQSESSSGFVLILCTFLSIILANRVTGMVAFWNTPMGSHSITEWINDGLMAIFFLLIGLELEREFYAGELAKLRDAILPVSAAIGGMLVPAIIFIFFNYGLPTSNAFGIPMATDIAFAVAILGLLGKRVPLGLKVFLTALAVIDDLGAILCIALFYSKTINGYYLAAALGIFLFLLALNRLKVRNLIPYLVLGVGMWYCMLSSGIHATISGILLAFAIPFGNGDAKSSSYILQQALHKPVAFLILPLFALANTCIVYTPGFVHQWSQPVSLGVFLGLLVGKPIGIFLSVLLVIKLKWVEMPQGLTWLNLFFAGVLGGIGFTMSIFITLLALPQEDVVNHIKWVILLASFSAGMIGYIGLRLSLTKPVPEEIP